MEASSGQVAWAQTPGYLREAATSDASILHRRHSSRVAEFDVRMARREGIVGWRGGDEAGLAKPIRNEEAPVTELYVA
jgi:hypothetical protein